MSNKQKKIVKMFIFHELQHVRSNTFCKFITKVSFNVSLNIPMGYPSEIIKVVSVQLSKHSGRPELNH